jgi:hypothetical protein
VGTKDEEQIHGAGDDRQNTCAQRMVMTIGPAHRRGISDSKEKKRVTKGSKQHVGDGLVQVDVGIRRHLLGGHRVA